MMFHYMITVPPDMLIQDRIEAENQVEAYRIVKERYPKAQGIVPTDEPLRGDGVMKSIDTGPGDL